MVVLNIFIALAVGFIISIIFVHLVSIGLHHMIHCIETMFIILSIILFAINKCYWYVFIILAIGLWRQVFRVICDCSDILKEQKTNK